MAHKSGTTTSSFGGLGVSGDGDLGVVGGSSKHQTALAQLTAPPADTSWVSDGVLMAICLAVPLIVFFLILVIFDQAIIGAVVALIVMGGMFAGSWKFSRNQSAKAKAAYKAKMMKWEHSWICLKCGNTYYVR